jgi:hypothetical protein
VVIGGTNIVEELQEGEYHFDGLLLLAEHHGPDCKPLFDLVCREKLSWKIIFQVVGCNQDEMETRHLLKADLIITDEMPEAVIIDRMAALFDGPG